MTIRMFIVASSAAILVAEVTRAADTSREHFALSAETAVLYITPRDAGATFLTLPALEFRFRLLPRCSDGGRAMSFSLNVADSRISLQEAQLADAGANPFRDLRLTVPPEQLAPVAVREFCMARPAEDDGTEAVDESPHAPLAEEMLIPSVLAAQASLLCRRDDMQSMSYVSRSLDLRLVCRDEAETAPDPSPD